MSWLTNPRRVGYVLLVPVMVIASALVPREFEPYVLALCYATCILQVSIAIVNGVRGRTNERERMAESGIEPAQ